jgi:hypothetical protein
LSDKKGYHGSLPVPSVAAHARCVQYCCAPVSSFQAKGTLHEPDRVADGKFGK